MILPLPSLLYKSVRPKSRLVYFSHSSPFSFLANPLFRRLDVWKCIFRRLDVWKFRCLAILLASSAFLHQPSTTLWFLWFFANPPPLQPSNPLSFLTLCLSLRAPREKKTFRNYEGRTVFSGNWHRCLHHPAIVTSNHQRA